MRIIHTADWQIGKPFKKVGDKEELFRQSRLSAIETIGALAGSQKADHVLVAGDIYDSEAPTDKTLREPLERMRLFPSVHWHLLPGNHDPHRPKGIWDRVLATGAPPNVRLHLEPEPHPLGDEAILLPAPLTRKSRGGDPTEWMDNVDTPAGIIRIGLAHGSIVGFGTAGEANNPIAPDRPDRARLDYLALGDWHRTVQVGPSAWYAGTMEPDRVGSQEQGQVLVVDIERPGALAIVTQHIVGSYRWHTREERLDGIDELEDFETRLRNQPELSSTVLRLVVKGTLSLAGHTELHSRLKGLGAALFHLDVDDSELFVRPTNEDLETIDFSGVLRDAAERLKAVAGDESTNASERKRAEDALVELFVMADSAARSRGAAV